MMRTNFSRPKSLTRIALAAGLIIGTKLKVNDRLNFRIQGGVVYNLYLGPDAYNDYDVTYWFGSKHYSNIPWESKKSEISRIFRFGLEYHLNKSSYR